MKIRTAIHLTTLTLFTCLTYTPATYAATTTTTFDVTATVPSSCSVSSGGSLAFGNYSGSQVDGSTTISITCTNGTTYTAGLGNGLNFSTTRRMLHGTTDYLSYELYKDSGRSSRWGDTGGELVSDTGSGAAQSKTIYGRITASQTPPIGDYTDTILVTVTY